MKILTIALVASLLAACSSEPTTDSSVAGNDVVDEVPALPAAPLPRWRDPNSVLVVGDAAVAAALHDAFDGSPIPGAIGAIADRGGDVRVAAIGLRKAGAIEEMTVGDLLHIGSDTKAMTAVLVARHVDKGLLRWDSTIEEVLPGLAERIDPGYRAVTITELLHHTSGAPANAVNWRGHQGPPIRERRIELAAESLANPPEAAPGSAFLYSNLGVMIAGAMVEAVGDASWEELMVRDVFEPLGMSSAGFGAPGPIGEVEQPWGHIIEASGRARPMQIDNDAALGPAGTVHLSIEDWARFTLEFTDSAAADLGFLSAESRAKLVERGLDDYACGWVLVERPWAGGTALTHSGSNTTWYATAWVAPRKDKAFLVVVNAAGFRVNASVDRAIGALIRLADTPGDPSGDPSGDTPR